MERRAKEPARIVGASTAALLVCSEVLAVAPMSHTSATISCPHETILTPLPHLAEITSLYFREYVVGKLA
jgi:hypothetical protein